MNEALLSRCLSVTDDLCRRPISTFLLGSGVPNLASVRDSLIAGEYASPGAWYSALCAVFDEAIEGARFGLNPQGMYNNRDYLEDKVAFASSVTRELQDVFFDPQTSGPLALAMSDEDAVRFVEIFGQPAAVIGHFTARKDVAISVL